MDQTLTTLIVMVGAMLCSGLLLMNARNVGREFMGMKYRHEEQDEITCQHKKGAIFLPIRFHQIKNRGL